MDYLMDFLIALAATTLGTLIAESESPAKALEGILGGTR